MVYMYYIYVEYKKLIFYVGRIEKGSKIYLDDDL